MLLCATSGNSVKRGARDIQRQLHVQQQKADQLTLQLADALRTSTFDSLHRHMQSVDDVLLYVYHDQQLVYWTGAWLSSSYLPMRDVYDTWLYSQWNNAQGICKRTQVGDFHVLTVIPIKYNYRVTRCLQPVWLRVLD